MLQRNTTPGRAPEQAAPSGSRETRNGPEPPRASSRLTSHAVQFAGGDGTDWLLVFSSAKERECESSSCGHQRDGSDHNEGIVEKRVSHDPHHTDERWDYATPPLANASRPYVGRSAAVDRSVRLLVCQVNIT